ncbi:MAG: hypothetical protein IJ475_00185 [Bacilli bacterium]|nr:hypothetical protein [Bacilli bacterium]
MKLPSVYANKIDRKIDNNEEYYRAGRDTKRKNVSDLRSYFDRNGYVNKLNVLITTDRGTREEKLILYRSDHFVNINNDRIYFKDIIDYDIKK